MLVYSSLSIDISNNNFFFLNWRFNFKVVVNVSYPSFVNYACSKSSFMNMSSFVVFISKSNHTDIFTVIIKSLSSHAIQVKSSLELFCPPSGCPVGGAKIRPPLKVETLTGYNSPLTGTNFTKLLVIIELQAPYPTYRLKSKQFL